MMAGLMVGGIGDVKQMNGTESILHLTAIAPDKLPIQGRIGLRIFSGVGVVRLSKRQDPHWSGLSYLPTSYRL